MWTFVKSCLTALLILGLPVATEAWGSAFGPVRGGFGPSSTSLHALHRRRRQEEESEFGRPNNADPDDTDTTTSYFSDLWGVDGYSLANSVGAFFFPKPLMWESSHENSEFEEYDYEDEMSFGDEEVDCNISDDFRVDDNVAADALAFLGIQRVKPLLPAFEFIGEFE